MAAERATLGDWLRPEVAGRLAEQLPRELKPGLHSARPASAVATADDFVALVAER
jgi:uncharacterized protein (DUF2267 family)